MTYFCHLSVVCAVTDDTPPILCFPADLYIVCIICVKICIINKRNLFETEIVSKKFKE